MVGSRDWITTVHRSFDAFMASSRTILKTPDGRYIVVRGRLWRASNPDLSDAERDDLVGELMAARRAVAAARKTSDRKAEDRAHEAVQAAKIGLGERGPVWWTDGEPDLNRHLARTTRYADWFADVSNDAADALRGCASQ